jgi:hypothetical protein
MLQAVLTAYIVLPLGCSVQPNGPVMQALAADAIHQDVHLIAGLNEVQRGLQHTHVRLNAAQQHLQQGTAV